MREFIAVHQGPIKTVVRVEAISHYFEQNGKTTICFVGGDQAIVVREDLDKVTDMIGASYA